MAQHRGIGGCVKQVACTATNGSTAIYLFQLFRKQYGLGPHFDLELDEVRDYIVVLIGCAL